MGLLQRLRQPPIPAVAGLLQDGDGRRRGSRPRGPRPGGAGVGGDAARRGRPHGPGRAAGRRWPGTGRGPGRGARGPGRPGGRANCRPCTPPSSSRSAEQADRRADLVLALAARLARLQPEDAAADLLAGVRTLVGLTRSDAEPFACAPVRSRAWAAWAARAALEALVERAGDIAGTRSCAGWRPPPWPVIESRWSPTALRAAMSDDDPEVRELAAAGLGSLRDDGVDAAADHRCQAGALAVGAAGGGRGAGRCCAARGRRTCWRGRWSATRTTCGGRR